MEGWIKLHRIITENTLYFSEPFTRSQAWIDMLIIANSKEGMFFKRGIQVVVKRGQIGYDIETLAKRWKWSRGKCERFFLYLETTSQIVRQKNNVTTLISICNYETYQSNDKADNNASSKPNDKANGHQTDTNKNRKNIKKDNISILSWREKFENYKEDLRKEYKEIIKDKNWIKERQKYHPNLNILLSLEKCCVEYWATEAGWKKKKASKTEVIDWKATFTNALSLKSNQVYLSKDEQPKKQSTTDY